MKFFCRSGPINPQDHYFVANRATEGRIRQLIAEKRYFILHAPRQTGKTTELLQLVKKLNQEGQYTALYINVEPAQIARNNVDMGMKIILERFFLAADKTFPPDHIVFSVFKELGLGCSLSSFLQKWCKNNSKPIILFIDEIDSLIGDTLIAVLRQLRADYEARPTSFPQSVCLVGVRDVRDYRIWSEQEQSMILGGSAFNIKDESLTLANFTKEQVFDLFNQHTQEHSQKFTQEALDEVFYLTQGQPWLCNALGYQTCFVDVLDRTQEVTRDDILRAKETLILRRDTHIDQLVHKLKEPRVRMIIDFVLSGGLVNQPFNHDDVQYCIDLGLISRNSEKTLTISNPIYQEVIPRELTFEWQATMSESSAWYQNSDGSLNMLKLLQAFQQFYREHAEIWLHKESYVESGPHIILMAFLQRIINGGGTIAREYALGRKRVDLFIKWPKQDATQRIVIELKVYRDSQTKSAGLEQTWQYMQQVGATEGHLVIFDRRPDKAWEEKIYQEISEFNNTQILVWGA